MKKTWLVAFFAGLFVLISCNKATEESSTGNTKAAQKPTPCCEVTCSNGDCKAYGSPCSCTCTFLGKPECSGSTKSVAAMPDSVFDGRIHVTLNRDFLQNVAKDQEALRSLNKPYANELADVFDSYKSLIEKYGYELKTREALTAYYTLIDKEDAAEKQFTIEELEYLSNR